MTAFVTATAVLLAIVYYDIIPKWKRGLKKAFWVSVAFLAAGYFIMVLRSFDIILLSPLKPIEDLVRSLMGG